MLDHHLEPGGVVIDPPIEIGRGDEGRNGDGKAENSRGEGQGNPRNKLLGIGHARLVGECRKDFDESRHRPDERAPMPAIARCRR